MELQTIIAMIFGLLILLLFYIAFKLAVRIEKVEQSITKLVRELALRKK